MAASNPSGTTSNSESSIDEEDEGLVTLRQIVASATALTDAARLGNVQAVSSVCESFNAENIGLDTINFVYEVPFESHATPVPPLLAACQAGQIEVVRILLTCVGIDVNFSGRECSTPLSAAACRGYVEIIILLLEHSADVDHFVTVPVVDTWSALYLSVINNHYDAAVLLVQNGANVNICGGGLDKATPLMAVAELGYTDFMILLLDNGANVQLQDDLFMSALSHACEMGNVECAKLLIKYGAKVDENGFGTPLTSAIKEGRTECVKLLLDNGANVNRPGVPSMFGIIDPPLSLASLNGYLHLVQLLLDRGADVNNVKRCEYSALDLAVQGGYHDVAELLIKHGAKRFNEDYDADKSETEDDADNEEKHLEFVKTVMKEKGTLDHTLAHGVLVGPARSGKSSLMSRLVGEIPSSDSPSTGVAEQVIQVGVKKSYSVALGVQDSIWYKLLYDDEAIRLIKLASRLHTVNLSEKACSSLTEEILTALPSTTVSQSSQATNFTLLADIIKQVTEPPLPVGYTSPMDVFKAALQKRGLEGLRQHLEDSWSLYLTDTGGQIEFQELLPLLVSGPSIFFLTFRLDQALDQRFTIEYHLPDGGRSAPYQSTLTVKEAILQTLASVASMGTFVYQGQNVESIPLKPKVFIIGTHKDKLDQTSANTVIEKIDHCLQTAIKSTTHYKEDLVEYASETQLIYTVNNLSQDDSDFNKIRAGVERVICRRLFKISFPSHWLVFSLVLRQETIEDSIISYNQCSVIAKDCGISSKEELDHALWFLHTKIGLIRHFSKPLDTIVIRHPQILFDTVTKLIVNTFTFENLSERCSAQFKNKGIFTIEEYKQVEQRSFPMLPPRKLLQLLEHLRIIASFQEEGQEKFFIRCVLAHSEQSKSQTIPKDLDVPPLLITFKCGYCPKGLSGALIVYLMTNEMGSKFKWELMTEQIYRNEVTFGVSPSDVISLKIHLTHLEIAFSCTSAPKSTLEICRKVRHYIEKGIRKVSSEMDLKSYADHSLSFYCKNTDCSKEVHPATQISKFEDGSLCNLWCRKSGSVLKSPLPDGCSVWFEDVQKGDQSNEKQHQYSSIPHNQPQANKKPELRHAFRVLLPLASEWKNIGVLLGIAKHNLNTIQSDNPKNTTGCLNDMLEKWLTLVEPQPTWSSLAGAVECFDPSIAKAIQEKYIQ